MLLRLKHLAISQVTGNQCVYRTDSNNDFCVNTSEALKHQLTPCVNDSSQCEERAFGAVFLRDVIKTTAVLGA